MVFVDNLCKKFGDNSVLDGLNLEILAGDSFALIGPNGAGKTTLVKILSTLLKPTLGTVCVSGYDVTLEPEEVRKRIGVTSHNTFLYDDLTAKENLEFYGELYGLNKDEIEKKVDLLLKKANLRLRAHDQVSNFSRGMKQRLSIVRAIICDPDILILDEPSTGLDVASKKKFYEMVREQNTAGKTILLATHDLREVEMLCTKAAILDKGKIQKSGKIKDLKSDGLLEDVFTELTN